MFKITLLIFSVILSSCIGAPTDDDAWSWRIVGGTKAPDGAYPYQASLRTSVNFHFCGGIIITDRTILTAGHCLAGRNPKGSFAALGTNKLSEPGVQYEAEKLIVHPFYDISLIINDVALMIVEKNIEFTAKIQPIPMEYGDIGGEVTVQLSGWGSTYLGSAAPNDLQQITLKTVTNDFCKAEHLNPIISSEICTLTVQGEGACHGDSGGPLTANGNVVGIVSWGSPCARGKPDVFSRVSSFTEWIDDNKL